MAKFYVVEGSLQVDRNKTVRLGEAVELDEKQARVPLELGTIVDEKTFNGLRKMVEGASEAGAPLKGRERKLAAALHLGPKPTPKADVKPEKKP